LITKGLDVSTYRVLIFLTIKLIVMEPKSIVIPLDEYIELLEIKLHHCKTNKKKDSNITQLEAHVKQLKKDLYN
jgi:hypothetical protein